LSTTGAAWSRTFFHVSATVSETVSAAADARLRAASRADAARLCVASAVSAAALLARLRARSMASAARLRALSSASAAMFWALSARSSAALRIAAIAEFTADDGDERPLERTTSATSPISAAPAAAEIRSALVGSLRA
jgi:hypothetical protein